MLIAMEHTHFRISNILLNSMQYDSPICQLKYEKMNEFPNAKMKMIILGGFSSLLPRARARESSIICARFV